MNTPSLKHRHCQSGVTLVETMVSLALGMLVSAALLVLFADASGNGQNVQRASIQIENGRYAAELLREDLQMAGFYGELATDGAAWTTPDPCSTAPTTAFAASPLGVPAAVQGYGAAQALACLTSRNRLAGTDAFVVRRLEVARVNAGGLGTGNEQFYLQTSFCSQDPAATPLVFSKTPTAFTLRDRSCVTANTNPSRAYVSRIYFVASCNVCGTGGDSIPTLKRLDLVANQLVETPLVDGIETLRLEYGFDTDGNGSADTYLTGLVGTGATSQWQNVMALKVHFVVRSNDAVVGSDLAAAQTFTLGGAGTVTAAADGFVRRSYSTTVRLINPSGNRELQ